MRALTFFAVIISFFFVIGKAEARPSIAVGKTVVVDTVSLKYRERLLGNVFTDEVENALLLTRKFKVLARKKEALKEIFDEQKKSASALFKGNKAVMGNLDNADYVVQPSVQMFDIKRQVKKVPNIENKYRAIDTAEIRLAVKIMDTDSGEIKAVYMINKKEDMEKIYNEEPEETPEDKVFSAVIKTLSSEISDKIINTVFPVKVIDVKGNDIWINRGNDGSLQEGDVLEVYKTGEALIDPDTGENLGKSESLVGKIKVIKINPKFSIAEKFETEAEIEKGSIVRK